MNKTPKNYPSNLNDNPHKFWFKRKLNGWGWTPARWQGWVVLIAYIVAVVKITIIIDSTCQSLSETVTTMFWPFIALTAILFLIFYIKGDRPKWQWGSHKER